MYKTVNSFFVTKIAAKKDEIVDPGEAAAAGLALTSGPVAQIAVPYIGRKITKAILPPPIRHTGAPLRGSTLAEAFEPITHLEGTGRFVKVPDAKYPIPEITEGSKKLIDRLNKQTYKIFNLFDVTQKSKPWWKTTGSPAIGELFDPIERIGESVDSMIQKYKLPQKGVTVELTSGTLAKEVGPYYDIANKRVTLPWINKAFALHEVGHAAHLTKPGARTFDLLRKLFHGGTIAAIPMAYIAGNEIKELMPGRLDDKVIDFVQKNAPVLLAGSYLGATLYPEMQATTRAVHHVWKTEGPQAAKKVLKALLPALGSYLIPIIPTMVGLSLAKKWFFEAQKKKKSQEKTANIIQDIKATGRFLSDLASETTHIFGQMNTQASQLLHKPGKQIASRIYEAGKANIKSPAFAYGAVLAGVPALTATYVIHNTPEGKVFAERNRLIRAKMMGRDPVFEAQQQLQKAKQEKHHDSITFPAIVGLGAAISGGFLTKFFTDILRVL